MSDDFLLNHKIVPSTLSLLNAEFYDRVSEIILHLRRKGLRLGIAESCTGGLLCAELARHPGISDVFSGGVVTYSNEAKSRLLQVSGDLIEKHGAVSSQVVGAMAMGALNSLDSDWALSISGVAGPSGGTVDKPVGLVWFGIGHKDMLKTMTQKFTGDRREVQERAVIFATELLFRELR